MLPRAQRQECQYTFKVLIYEGVFKGYDFWSTGRAARRHT